MSKKEIDLTDPETIASLTDEELRAALMAALSPTSAAPDAPTDTTDTTDETKEVFVFGHVRRQPVTHEQLMCEICGENFIAECWPGMNKPRFCGDDCRKAYNREKMRRWRAEKKRKSGD